MSIKFNYINDMTKPSVICDTNVWYGIANGTFKKPNNISLIPTSLTLVELASTEAMAYDIKLYCSVIKGIYDNCGPIIPVNPFDFILSNHDSDYPADDSLTKKVLEDFTQVLKIDISKKIELDEKTQNKIIEECQKTRSATIDFANFGTENLMKIRKNINKGVGKKDHLKVDPSEINKEMLKSFLNEHVKDKDYTINFENFEWENVELFLIVTEIFFKKLETTKDMKFKPNDAVDWLNMLYVTQNDQYLTFEKSWRSYIENDERIKHYLYEINQ